MATFCIRIGMKPDEYRRMTYGERQAFIDAWNEMNEVDE